jgi:hypothetical protein
MSFNEIELAVKTSIFLQILTTNLAEELTLAR